MLDLIVMGEIPGTHIQVTHTMVIAFAAILIGVGTIIRILRRTRLDRRSAGNLQDIISL